MVVVSRRGLVMFLTLGVLWGIPYLLIKVAVGELSPAMVVLGRTAPAALLLLPLAAVRREILPALRRWRPLAAYTVAELIVPWYCLTSAERRLPSSTAGLLLAAVPLVAVGVAYALGSRAHLSARNWAGIVVGMAGVAAIVGLHVGGSTLLPVAEIGVVAVGYAFGPAILDRWLTDVPALGVVALSLALTAIVYLPLTAITGGFPTQWPSGRVVGSVLGLAVGCSAIAFVVMIALIAEIGPVRATAITYVNPAVAILAGAVFLGERLTSWTLAGFVLVLAGSYLVTHRRAPAPAPTPESTTAPEPVRASLGPSPADAM